MLVFLGWEFGSEGFCMRFGMRNIIMKFAWWDGRDGLVCCSVKFLVDFPGLDKIGGVFACVGYRESFFLIGDAFVRGFFVACS